MNMVPEKTIEECKRHVDECAALLERTSVPEYREAIIAMAKAWMKIAEQAKIEASRLTSFGVLRSSKPARVGIGSSAP